MFGIRFMKVAPTTYALHYKDGKVVREGTGLGFFYYAPTSTIVLVSMASADVPFVFKETSADFQEVTVQGQLVYRVTDPKRLGSLLDLSVDAKGKYLAEDVERLGLRLVQETQILVRASLERLDLKQALAASEALVQEVLPGLRNAEAVTRLGVEVLGLSILSVRPTPEMARALEAQAREDLQQKADGAIYERRNAAVEQERRIKESELNTELAVEQRRREIREAQMAADIAVEEQRRHLIDQKVENDRKEAESRVVALRATLQSYKDMDWRTLLAMAVPDVAKALRAGK